MSIQITKRKEFSTKTRANLRSSLIENITRWTDATELQNNVCIYTTGSFGRSDASQYSDLDVFIISSTGSGDQTKNRRLSNLVEIELLGSIISANRALNLPELDADGCFLKAHTVDDYLKGLGKPDDDMNNTFTGRLLLLLESQPLFGDSLYNEIKENTIRKYWTDYSDHADSFLPAFLLNDILRFWRTLCINYESKFENSESYNSHKRRAKNYKLKYSRVLTCFATVIGLQVLLVKNGSVSPKDAIELSDLTPIERLNKARGICSKSRDLVESIVQSYDDYLAETDCSKIDLENKMKDGLYYKKSLESARDFGDLIFKLMVQITEGQEVGTKSWRFLRYATV